MCVTKQTTCKARITQKTMHLIVMTSLYIQFAIFLKLQLTHYEEA